MAARSAGPCAPWTPIWCGEIPISGAAISGDMLMAATEILWSKSGRQFDSCTQVLRPCNKDCWGGVWPFGGGWGEWQTGWPYPYNFNGQWFNLGCGGCPGTCSCSVIYEAQMPAPIANIVEILIDGSPLVSGSYTVYDHQMLIRTDGQPWPMCNDLNLPNTAVGTWSVEVEFGTEVPKSGQLAVGELALQLINALCDVDACSLPKPVQQLVRQGVSLTFLDPNEIFADGRVGLYFCDLFISTFNPGGIPARAQVIDVDSRGPRRVTWPP